MATLDSDDLDAIESLINAALASFLPAGFSTLIITGGQLDGLAGPVVATDPFGNAVASATNVAAIKAKTDQLTFLGGYVDANIRSVTDLEGNQRSITSPGGSDGDPITIHQLSSSAIAAALTVLPGRDRGLPQSNRGRIVVAQGELITISRQVVDGNGAAVNLAGRTLQFIIQDARGVDVAVIPNSSITISGTGNNTYTFTMTSPCSARSGNFSYWLNDLGASKAELAKGDWIVEARPLADS